MASIPVRPSETTDFVRCSRLWYWKHVEGWEPPPSAWTPERLMGTAVHAGLQSHWEGIRTCSWGPNDSGVALTDALVRGWPSDAPPEYSFEGLQAQSLKVLDKVLAWIAKEMSDAKPVMVEQPLGPDGHTTPDLVTEEQGQLIITDWKTHWNLDADRVRYRLEGLERTHQFLHYSWAVSQHLGRPVDLFRKVVIVGSPRILVRAATFNPTGPSIEYWLTGARQMWSDMQEMRAGTKVAWMNTNGCFQYGAKWPCPYLDACFTCHGIHGKMKQFLVKR